MNHECILIDVRVWNYRYTHVRSRRQCPLSDCDSIYSRYKEYALFQKIYLLMIMAHGQIHFTFININYVALFFYFCFIFLEVCNKLKSNIKAVFISQCKETEHGFYDSYTKMRRHIQRRLTLISKCLRRSLETNRVCFIRYLVLVVFVK